MKHPNGDVGQADATSGEWQIGSFGENVGGVDGGDRYESNRKSAKEEWKPGWRGTEAEAPVGLGWKSHLCGM
jgi:hypothetical protein